MCTWVAFEGTTLPFHATRPGVLTRDPCCVITSVHVLPGTIFVECARRTSLAVTVRVHFPISCGGGGAAAAAAVTTSAATTSASRVFMQQMLRRPAPRPDHANGMIGVPRRGGQP